MYFHAPRGLVLHFVGCKLYTDKEKKKKKIKYQDFPLYHRNEKFPYFDSEINRIHSTVRFANTNGQLALLVPY